MMKVLNKLHNTEPIVFHNPKGEDAKWGKIKRAFFAQECRKIGSINDGTIITWNNGKRGTLERTLDHLGVPYKVLGKKIRRWRNDCKLGLTRDALSNITTKYVMGFDSCDVLVIDDPQIVIERFAKTGLKLMFNAGCGVERPPVPEVFIKFADAKPPFHFLNAGVWIGELEFLRDFFGECVETIDVVRKLVSAKAERYVVESEQKHIKHTAKNQRFREFVGIDSECTVFQVVDPVHQKLIEVIDSRKHIKML